MQASPNALASYVRLRRPIFCAFGRLVGIVFGEADPPLAQCCKVERVVLNALANHMLPFGLILALSETRLASSSEKPIHL